MKIQGFPICPYYAIRAHQHYLQADAQWRRHQASMVTERYAHILDDSRRMNAERFQQQFYSGPVSEEPATPPDPLQQLDAGEKQALLIKLLAESPEMVSVMKSLAQAI